MHQPASAVAAIAAARLDLVIHVGDYHYRETAWPPVARDCSASPSGYAGGMLICALFDAAVLILIHGNHCDRAGEGWFRFAD
jgi:hypothetical protein